MSSHEWRINAGTRILITLLAIGCHSRWLDWLTLPRLKRRLTTATNRASKIQPSIWPVPCEDHPKLRQHEGERERGEERNGRWKWKKKGKLSALSPQLSKSFFIHYYYSLFARCSTYCSLFVSPAFNSAPPPSNPFFLFFFIFFILLLLPFFLLSLSPPARLFYSLLLPPPPLAG